MVIWLIGLSGAGKTTVGNLLTNRLRETHKNVVFLDGDVIRNVYGDDLGHSVDARRTNAERITRLAGFLEDQGQIVVVAILSIFPDMQRHNRRSFTSYTQIYLEADLRVLESRDGKGLYAGARRGEVTDVVGIDIPFPEPYRSDFVFNTTDGKTNPDLIVDAILAQLPQIGS